MQSSNSRPESERLGRESSLCNYKRSFLPQRPLHGVVTKSVRPLKCKKIIHPENVMRDYEEIRQSETVLIGTKSPVAWIHVSYICKLGGGRVIEIGFCRFHLKRRLKES